MRITSSRDGPHVNALPTQQSAELADVILHQPVSSSATRGNSQTELYKALYPDGVALASYLLLDRSRGEDIAQETLAHLMASGRIESVADARSFYLKAVRNRAKNSVRETARRLAREARYSQQQRNIHFTQDSESRVDVHAALAKLSQAEREVVVLTYWLSHSNDEISQLTGRSLSAVKSLKNRAFKKLKELLDVCS